MSRKFKQGDRVVAINNASLHYKRGETGVVKYVPGEKFGPNYTIRFDTKNPTRWGDDGHTCFVSPKHLVSESCEDQPLDFIVGMYDT